MSRLLAVVLIAATALTGCSSSETVRRPKAVFVIVVDTLRPDRLSCYGYSKHQTPNIDRIAEGGVLFERAQANASWTIPSMGAIMTSRYPTQLGLFERKSEKPRYGKRERRKQVRYTLMPSAHTLAEMMSASGFHTTAFVNQPFINSYQGFMQGFEEWCYPVSNSAVEWHNPNQPPADEPLPEGTELGQVDTQLVDEFIEWIGSAGEEPPFVWLHLLRPHWPYLPPPDLMADYPQDWRSSTPASDLYDIEITVADGDVGRILDAIDRHFGLDDCVIIFTSDHGEAFGEHAGLEHGHSLHTEVTHVPLIVQAPGLPHGRRSQTLVRGVDILPTILDLIGVSPGTSLALEGESLAPVIDGSGDGDRSVYAAGMLYGGTERSYTRDGYRLMYDHDSDKGFFLYDVRTDPQETANLAAEEPARAQSMRQEMLELYERYLADFRVAKEASDQNIVEEDGEENTRVLRAMRSLGYIK